MLAFEKVLEVFKEYLAEDANCELILTMQWDEKSKDWYGVEYCETHEDLRDELLSSYRMNEAEKITKTRRELTEEETALIETKMQNLAAQCE